MNDDKKNLLLSRDVGTLLMNVNRRTKNVLHELAQKNDYAVACAFGCGVGCGLSVAFKR